MVISEMEARVSLLVTWVCTYFPPLLVVLIICRERGEGKLFTSESDVDLFASWFWGYS